jgi:hypothetical protein
MLNNSTASVLRGVLKSLNRKSITVPFLDYMLNEMKTRITDLHTRTSLGLQLVPSIIENIAPLLNPPIKRSYGSSPGDRIVVGFTTTCAISAYHH